MGRLCTFAGIVAVGHQAKLDTRCYPLDTIPPNKAYIGYQEDLRPARAGRFLLGPKPWGLRMQAENLSADGRWSSAATAGGEADTLSRPAPIYRARRPPGISPEPGPSCAGIAKRRDIQS